MTYPLPKPENYIDKLEKNSDVMVKRFVMPNGNVVAVDYFQNLKNGSHCNKDIIDVFGCKACRWVDSESCVHYGDVTSKKPHANRICSHRLKIPLAIHEQGIVMTLPRMLQVRALMDAQTFSRINQKQANDGKRDINDVFAWEKLQADILEKMIKQDEGSKLTVVKNSLDDLRKTISVDVKSKGVDYDGLRKEKEEVDDDKPGTGVVGGEDDK